MAQNQNQEVSTPEQLSPNNLVVRIDQDSDSDLQALFDTVLNPDANRQLQVPLRLRNLPSSFFKPPSNGSKSSSVSHSRDNSADSAFDSGSAPGTHQVTHSRAHSSPASLQQTYVMGQQQNLTTHHHSKQRSYDSINPNDQIPLPPGWEQARTAEGQIYYLNHITCTTTWEDPRKRGQMNQHQLQLSPQEIPTQIPLNLENKPSAITELRPLPYGWEQSTTAEGEIYFINHQTRTTSWFDPRIPAHLQRSPTNSVLPIMATISSQEQVTQQKMRLQMLQLERERLKQRQEEIRRQQGMMLQSNVTMDSYLSDLAEHSRQESADSGLGMGTATNVYPISDSPDNFLANISNVIDHMDCASEEVLEEFPNVTLDDVQSLINPSATPPEMAPNVNDLTWL